MTPKPPHSRTPDDPGGRDRRDLRVRFEAQRVRIELFHADGTNARVQLAVRDLSRYGIGGLHDRHVDSHTPCELTLPRLDGQQQVISGRVLRCTPQPVGGYEVALRFDHPLSLEDFVDLDLHHRARLALEARAAAEAPDRGSPYQEQALVLEAPSEAPGRYAAWLASLGVWPTEPASVGGAMQFAGTRRFDLAMIDLEFGRDEGLWLTRWLRSEAFGAPILAVSRDGSAERRSQAIAAGATVFLASPINPEKVPALVEGVLRVPLASGAADPPMAPAATGLAEQPQLVRQFVTGLPEHLGRIRHASLTDDRTRLLASCELLARAGRGLGFDPIAEAAARLAVSLADASACTETTDRAVTELVGLLRRARAA